MDITGLIAIGNDEKCPFCEIVVNERNDTFDHIIENHKEDVKKILFGDEE